MRIGFDMDGVLSNFVEGFRKVLVDVTGKDLLEAGDTDNPPVWNVWKHRGYTNKEVDAAWRVVDQSETFWEWLPPKDGARILAQNWYNLDSEHDIYFITHRVNGFRAKRQTEGWLVDSLIENPTVIISPYKGLVCRALSLDCYIDDKISYVVSAVDDAPKTRIYLLDYKHNQDDSPPSYTHYKRVPSVEAYLEREHMI